MRFLVIGSASALGGGLAEELSRRGHAITLLAEDPRKVSEDWKLRFRCHYGSISNAHVLHAAMEGADRILLALSHPRLPGHSQQEPTQVKQILEANRREGKCPVFKLTSWGSVFATSWWVMGARKKADQLVRQDPHGHLYAVGWLAESLLRIWHRNVFWVPKGLDGRILWISRDEAVKRLSDLFLLPAPPTRETVAGSVRMSFHEAAAHVLSRCESGRNGLVRIPFRADLRKLLPWLPEPLYAMERALWGCQTDDPETDNKQWTSSQDPFAEVLRDLDS